MPLIKPISYTLLLQTSPSSVTNCTMALTFCKELLSSKQHTIHCLFLQNDAVYLGLNNYAILQDEANLQLSWQEFVANYQIPAFICTNSALRRGIFDTDMAALYKKQNNLASMFKLASLGTLFEAMSETKRFIQL